MRCAARRCPGALVLLMTMSCVPVGGGGGGRDDGGRSEEDGAVETDAGLRGDMFVDLDDGIPPPDMFVDPDDGVPPPDMAPMVDGDPPDAAPPVCEPRPETCNGADDDCDDTIDEDFGDLGEACADGIGPCERGGRRVCRPDGTGTVCDAEPAPAAEEQCNGEDDDCDGAVDEIALCDAIASPECAGATPIDDPERNIEQPGGGRCDTMGSSDLPFDQWLRFVPPAGERLPEAPPDANTCGTDAPGWLESGHPTVEDGVVPGTVCFHYFGDPCNWTADIEVRNCGDFYVYRLTPAPICRLQYCVE